MIWLAALIAAATWPPPTWNGPAILVVLRSNGTDYVPFSSAARCFAAKAAFEERQRRLAAENDKNGFHVIPGTEPIYECIPG